MTQPSSGDQLLSAEDVERFGADPLATFRANLATVEARISRACARAGRDRSSVRLLPITKTVYHRGSHMEGTVALKLGLLARGKIKDATVREPLKPLAPGAYEEIAAALKLSGLI